MLLGFFLCFFVYYIEDIYGIVVYIYCIVDICIIYRFKKIVKFNNIGFNFECIYYYISGRYYVCL